MDYPQCVEQGYFCCGFLSTRYLELWDQLLFFTLPLPNASLYLMLFASSFINFRLLLNLLISVISTPSLHSFHMRAWHCPGFYHHELSRAFEPFPEPSPEDHILIAAVLSAPPLSGNCCQSTQSVRSSLTPLNSLSA